MKSRRVDVASEISAAASAIVRPETCDLMHCTGRDFADQRLGKLFDAAKAVSRQRQAPDVISLADKLGEQVAWVSSVIEEGLTANPEAYAASIKMHAGRRKAYAIAERMADGADLQDCVHELIKLTHECPTAQTTQPIAMALRDALAEIEQGPRGTPWGLSTIDKKLGRLTPGHLYVIGARPAMGKTAFALTLALLQPGRSLFISGEQPAQEIALRALAITAGITRREIDSGSAASRIVEAAATLANRQVEIADMPAPTIADIVSVARREHFRAPLGAIFVDYLQRLRVAGQQARHYEVGDNVAALKNLARDLDVPVIVLAQVSRAVDDRQDKRPFLSDLKDSGIIEQEADAVMMLYREDVYTEGSLKAGVAEVLVEKNRHGPTGRLTLKFDAPTFRFSDQS